MSDNIIPFPSDKLPASPSDGEFIGDEEAIPQPLDPAAWQRSFDNHPSNHVPIEASLTDESQPLDFLEARIRHNWGSFMSQLVEGALDTGSADETSAGSQEASAPVLWLNAPFNPNTD